MVSGRRGEPIPLAPAPGDPAPHGRARPDGRLLELLVRERRLAVEIERVEEVLRGLRGEPQLTVAPHGAELARVALQHFIEQRRERAKLRLAIRELTEETPARLAV